MPRRFHSFRLWAVVLLLGLIGAGAVAARGESKPPPVRAWSHLPAL